MPTWVPMLGVSCVVVVIALLLYQRYAGSTWPSSPEHYVELARAQLSNQEPQRALDTLAFALRDATGETRKAALQLEADIRKLQVEVAAMPKVIAARNAFDSLQGFATRTLNDRPQRPAAREFVRLCDTWLSTHREACARHTDGAPLVRQVEEQRGRFVSLAALDEPDRPEDVMFAARSRLVFQWRDYRGALARLDAFLAANPAANEVRTERAKILDEGTEWLQSKLRTIDAMLSRNDGEQANHNLTQLERVALPEWASQVAERRQRLPK